VWWNRARISTVTAKEHTRSMPHPPAPSIQPTTAPSISSGSATSVPVSLPARQNPASAPLVTESTASSDAPGEVAPAAAVDSSCKVLLDLVAREETWVSVSSDGKKLFSGVLAPHESKTLAGKDSATMKIGNAAGVEVHLNGKLLAPLGARGQVLVVVFTPDAYQIVPPASREGD